MAQKKLANRHMVAEIGTMLAKGGIDYNLAHALIEGRVEIVEKSASAEATAGKPALQTVEAPPLSTYRLHVSYAKLPGVKALEKKFSGGDSVSVLFDGRAWTRHKSCAKIDETPGEREFLVAEIPAEFLGKRIDTIEDALSDHFDRLGYRFAIETEAVEFADAQPELQRKNWICALGSSALFDDDYRYVTVLGMRGRDRLLRGHWVDHGLVHGGRLLLVRK